MTATSKWDYNFLKLAEHIGNWSKDPKRKIGAVVVDDSRRILSTGYNGFPRGIIDTEERYLDRETKYKYVVHAEMNAIYNATYNGVALENSTLYVYGLPICSECAKGIMQAGIKRVVIYAPNAVSDRWLDSWSKTKEMFNEAGIEIKAINF